MSRDNGQWKFSKTSILERSFIQARQTDHRVGVASWSSELVLQEKPKPTTERLDRSRKERPCSECKFDRMHKRAVTLCVS